MKQLGEPIPEYFRYHSCFFFVPPLMDWHIVQFFPWIFHGFWTLCTKGGLKLSLALAHNSKVAWFLNDLKSGALETTCIIYIHLPLTLWKQANPISVENLFNCISLLPVLTLGWYSSKASWSWSAETTLHASLTFFIPFCLKCVS